MTNEEALKNANVRAFLDTISYSEGTTKHGYYTFFGGSRLPNLAAHPNRSVPFGKRGEFTSAAGRYQFLKVTWRDLAKKLKLPDFGPHSQDLGAVELLRGCGALPKILNNDFKGAVFAARKIWASFPGANYPGQGMRTIASLRAAFNRSLGGAQPFAGAKASGEGAKLPKSEPGDDSGPGMAGLIVAVVALFLASRM
jgi:muramidase (phage lysozyme)